MHRTSRSFVNSDTGIGAITGNPCFFVSFAVAANLTNNCAAAPSVKKPATTPAQVKYPALVDVGAKKCIPCKMMAPILDELSSEYTGRLRVEFIDVQIDPVTATKLGVRGIPTQIFYDASGKERHRHLGYYISKEDILATFKKLGIQLDEKKGK